VNYVACGIGRCKVEADVLCWDVPMCHDHWNLCCKEAPGCSVPWLRKRVRADLRKVLPAQDPEVVRATRRPDEAPRTVRIARPSRLVRIARPVRIAKPSR